MNDVESLEQNVNRLRSILVDVGTGQRRIQDAESEYVKLRGDVTGQLKSHKIADPNVFHSLWDWYGYWKKANGLGSWQSRREYISALYRPVMEALESARNGPPPPDTRSFSERHGFAPATPEPVNMIYEDAPEAVQRVIIDVALKTGWSSNGLLSLASRMGKRPWELSEPIQSQTPAELQLKKLLLSWPWYRVYDFAEAIASSNWEEDEDPGAAEFFEEALNDYFQHAGIGWQLQGGKLVARGSEALQVALNRTAASLKETPLRTAQNEIHEALADLSRRPVPDLTGAVQHAMAALECVARTAANDRNPTLGTLLKQHPGLVPPPLDTAIEKAWGYASNMGRHLKEGHAPTREEAELIVGVATVVATYLSRKTPKDEF